MSEQKQCLKCGSTSVADGCIQSTGKVSFRVKDATFITARTSYVPVNANLCVDCGHVELVGNTERAKMLVKTV